MYWYQTVLWCQYLIKLTICHAILRKGDLYCCNKNVFLSIESHMQNTHIMSK